MSVKRLQQFIETHKHNPPETFQLGGKQFTWAQALKYTDQRIDHEATSDMVQANHTTEAQDHGAGDSQSQE